MKVNVKRWLAIGLCTILLYGLILPQVTRAIWPIDSVLEILEPTGDILSLEWTPVPDASDYKISINDKIVETVTGDVYSVELTKSLLSSTFLIDFNLDYTVEIKPVVNAVELDPLAVDIIQFADPYLEGAILQALADSNLSTVLSSVNLSQITYLDATGLAITDLTGLSSLTQLQTLILSNNQLDNYDMSHITQLENLRDLDLSYNQISSASFLDTMVDLKHVDLTANRIESFTELITFSNHVHQERPFVDLSFNPVDIDFTDTEGALWSELLFKIGIGITPTYPTKIWDTYVEFELDFNYMGDIPIQSYNIYVDSMLYDTITATEIDSGLAEHYTLGGLDPGETYSVGVQVVFSNEMERWISGPVNVSTIYPHPVTIPDDALREVIYEELQDKEEPDIITVLDMMSLTELQASERGIRDLTGLEFATYLESVDLSNNLIYDLSPLCYHHLHSLNVSNNRLTQLNLYSGSANEVSNYIMDPYAMEGSISVYGNYLTQESQSEIEKLLTEAPQAYYSHDRLNQNVDSVPWPEASTVSQVESESLSDRLTLNWSPQGNDAQYKVYVNGVAIDDVISDTSYTVMGLAPSKRYSIKVEAIVDGIESVTGPFVTAYTPHATSIIGLGLDEVWLDKETQANKNLAQYITNVADLGLVGWSTEDHGVATVDGNGQLTAVAPGVTTVRAYLLHEPAVYAEATVKVGSILTVSWAENSWYKGSLEGFEIAVRDAESEYSMDWGWTNAQGQVIFPSMSPGSYVFELSNSSDAPIEIISSSNGWAYIEEGKTHSNTLYMLPLKADPMSEDPFSILDVFHHLEIGLEDYDFSDVIDRDDLKKLLEQLPPEVEIMRPA